MWWMIIIFAYILGFVSGIIIIALCEAASRADDVIEEQNRIEYYKNKEK